MNIFLARQPIFDGTLQVVGYEILHRGNAAAQEAGTDGSLDGVSGSTLVDAVLGMGIPGIAGDGIAFLNVDETTLHSGVLDLLPTDRVVIELLESVPPTQENVELCRDLARKGFRIALDDYVHAPEYAPLLKVARIVKLDVLEMDPAEVVRIVGELRGRQLTLLAEKVEDAETHQRCVKLGFQLFQGFHYLRPETLTRKDLSAESVALLRLLSLLRDEDTTDAAIVEAFRSDPTLSYKLLRIINSAALGGRGVQSLSHALLLLGREPLYRWLSLLLVRSQGDGSGPKSELIRASLIRARMCELIGESVGSAFSRNLPDGGSLFLTGLLSEIDQLLGEPLTDILARIDLDASTREALISREGPAGYILRAVESYEVADWDDAEDWVRKVGADADALAEQYLESLGWARNRMAVHDD